ncbi:MAG: tetratricopeptide repeat protein [Bacteroidota bacterium]
MKVLFTIIFLGMSFSSTIVFGQEDQFIVDAFKSLYMGDTARAISICTKAITKDPLDTRAYNTRGWIYSSKSNFTAAIEDYNKALSLDSNFSVAWYNKGCCLFKLGSYKEAISDFDKCLLLDTAFSAAYDQREVAKLNLQLHQNPILSDNTATETGQVNAIFYFKRGLLKSQNWDLKGAVADYSEAIKMEPRTVYLYEERSKAYALLNVYEKAIDDCDHILALNPNLVDVMANKSALLFCAGRREEALTDINNLAKKYEKNYWVFFVKAQLEQRSFLYKECESDYKTAVLLNPTATDRTYGAMTKIYTEQHLYKEAISACDRGIAFNPNSIALLIARGNASLRMGLIKQSMNDYRKVISLDTASSAGFNNIGNLFRKIGMYDSALVYLHKSLQLSRYNSYPMENIALVQFGLGKYKDAIKGFDTLTAYEDFKVKSQVYHALVKEKMGDFGEAALYFDKAVFLDATYVPAYQQRGRFKLAAGDIDGAMADLSQAIILDTADPAAYNSRGYLHFKSKNYPAAVQDFEMAVALGKSFYQPYFAYRNEAVQALRGILPSETTQIEWLTPVGDVNNLINGTLYTEKSALDIKFRITSSKILQQQEIALFINEKKLLPRESGLSDISFKTTFHQAFEGVYAYEYSFTLPVPKGASTLECKVGAQRSQLLKIESAISVFR